MPGVWLSVDPGGASSGADPWGFSVWDDGKHLETLSLGVTGTKGLWWFSRDGGERQVFGTRSEAWSHILPAGAEIGVLAFEAAYVGKNPKSALGMGRERGRLIEWAVSHGCPEDLVWQLMPSEWRASLSSGYGVRIRQRPREAVKADVAHVCSLLSRIRPGSGLNRFDRITRVSVHEQEATLLGLAIALQRRWL